MKYWKCIDDKSGIDCTTSGKIYETDDLGIGLVDDKGFEFSHYQPWAFNATFEEVTYEDYILQEFVEGRIGIKFKNDDACEYWNKRLLPKVNNPIRYSMSTTKMNSRFRYYVDRGENRLKFDAGNEDLKVVVLSTPEENKKENEDMKKEFTKSDLVNGMVVETRDKTKYLVHNEFLLDADGYSHITLASTTEDLLDNSDMSEFDIVKVYRSNTHKIDGLFDLDYLDLIWERKEVEDLTKKEYKFELLTISPNGESYLEDEEDGIFIKKKNIYGICDSYIAISLEEAEFLIESLTEIVKTIEERN